LVFLGYKMSVTSSNQWDPFRIASKVFISES
jgi:hypothetical protein